MQPIRVLLVDDNPDFLQAAAHYVDLMPEAEIVGQVCSAREGIEQAEILDPQLVLMDLAMPDMTGIEATKQIKERVDAPRVVILTLHSSHPYLDEARASGADAVLDKVEFVMGFPALLREMF